MLPPSTLVDADVKRVFDELAEEILNVSDRIFPFTSTVDSVQATFQLSERAVVRNTDSDSFPEERIICPKARLQDITIEKPKVFKCRCCCVGEPHADNLTYKRKSLLTEELHPGGQRKWFLMVVKREMLELAILTYVSDWGFPSAKTGEAILHSSNDSTLLLKSSGVELQHYGVFQSPYTGKYASPEEKYASPGDLTTLLPKSYFCILPKGARLDKAAWEVRDTRICHKNNPLGRLVVTLQKPTTTYATAQGHEWPKGDVDFKFDLREVKDRVPHISQRGLLKSLQDLDIWISDYDENGKSIVSRVSWEELTRRETKSRDLRATFIKRTMRGERKDSYERVKIAIIDSGLHDRERSRYRVEYKDFTGVPTNDSWHGTCCAGIIEGMYEEARLYIARVFERDHADEIEGPLRMAKAIHWAIEPPRSVDIISISAGFRNYSKELDEAVTKAKAAGVLVIAAASNWQNTNTVAFPARHNLSTMCIYSTNTGNQSSSFNPEPRADTQNFAILGEGFQHPDQRRNERISGTSMATAVAAGLAARIVDFSRQQDNKASIFRAQDVGKLPGMLSIFSTISKPAGNLRYISPLELMPLRHGVSREADRQRVREVLSQAMERAN
ncbi:hypothetical protein FCIRC_11643 [Fusarium circinatum]|uniref:Peptidase S8/S53 domain-containing protein n=1 Tax=Fusarium circinatum TaxID=48490 RepID=A0A8H5T2R2_FUSCI|nr:hypothetical protein FCIRC_11643 [Fusarium circinatum]